MFNSTLAQCACGRKDLVANACHGIPFATSNKKLRTGLLASLRTEQENANRTGLLALPTRPELRSLPGPGVHPWRSSRGGKSSWVARAPRRSREKRRGGFGDSTAKAWDVPRPKSEEVLLLVRNQRSFGPAVFSPVFSTKPFGPRLTVHPGTVDLGTWCKQAEKWLRRSQGLASSQAAPQGAPRFEVEKMYHTKWKM